MRMRAITQWMLILHPLILAILGLLSVPTTPMGCFFLILVGLIPTTALGALILLNPFTLPFFMAKTVLLTHQEDGHTKIEKAVFDNGVLKVPGTAREYQVKPHHMRTLTTDGAITSIKMAEVYRPHASSLDPRMIIATQKLEERGITNALELESIVAPLLRRRQQLIKYIAEAKTSNDHTILVPLSTDDNDNDKWVPLTLEQLEEELKDVEDTLAQHDVHIPSDEVISVVDIANWTRFNNVAVNAMVRAQHEYTLLKQMSRKYGEMGRYVIYALMLMLGFAAVIVALKSGAADTAAHAVSNTLSNPPPTPFGVK